MRRGRDAKRDCVLSRPACDRQRVAVALSQRLRSRVVRLALVVDDEAQTGGQRVAECDALLARHPHLEPDADGARVLRSVLMKPEHEDAVGWLHARVEGLARTALA